MITLISLQAEIFDSAGYQKYVTQTDGSMDLIIQLASLKQKSLTYVYNNKKIQKILKNQSKREVIVNTVERIKEKLIRWRKFQRTTLDVFEGKKQKPATQQIEQPDTQKDSLQIKKQASSLIQKSVKFDTQIEEHPAAGTKEEKNQLLEMIQENNQRKTLPPELVDELIDKMAYSFVESKKNKLGRCARCYLCLQSRCVNQILFKNQKNDLQYIVKEQARGKFTVVPCELEKVMINETKEIIRNRYDNKQGVTRLWKLLNESKGKKGEQILQQEQLDSKIKLKQMTNTWRFTRNSSLFFKYIETLFYAISSNTDNIVYLSMMASMYQSAGLVSLIYPISIFGYALLEETRPRQEFWQFIRNYTITMLSIKFFINLKAFDPITNSEPFGHWNGLLMIGLRKQNNSVLSILFYLLPEMMILTFIMLTQVKLKLLGLQDKQEEEFESIKEGIQRYMFQGDIERVAEEKKKRTYMDMEKFFVSYNDQKDDLKEMQIEKEKEDKLKAAESTKLIADNQLDQSTEEEEKELTTEEKQEQLLSGISRSIFLCANEYDIDETGDVISPLDLLVKRKVIRKGLENDSLYYIEGATLKNDPGFINEENFEHELSKKTFAERALSSGDFKQEVEDIQNMLDSQNEETRKGIFEKNAYLIRIFPASIEQKPGVDYYGTTTMMLFIIAIYVINYFDKLFVTPEDLLQGAKDSNNIFSGKLSLILLFISIVVIIERFISRADVKVRIKQNNLDMEEKSYFNKQQQFARSTTQRSMTVKLKTMKTSDLDMTGAASQEFLSTITDQKDTRGPSTNVTKVSKQQKLKFYLHWLILICSHIFIFYYIPMIGNIELYGFEKGPKCNDDEKEDFKYGCKNFHSMWYSMVFYALICIYLYISAYQMRKGLPTFKIASSVLGDYEWYHGVRAQIYMMIPFAAELRCLCDFTFTKTSLDIFQYWQLFNYHIEMFIAKCGNDSYVQKVFGAKVLFEDNILGYLVLILLLTILIGPIIFFSEYAFIQANPVKDAQISVSLVIQKTLTKEQIQSRSVYTMNKYGVDETISESELQDALVNERLHLYEMAQNNSYIKHVDEEIDYDIIFGRKAKRSTPIQFDKMGSERNIGSQTFKKESSSFIEDNKVADTSTLRTVVPYLLFRVDDPNMRQINEDYLKKMPYNNWTETKFFKAEQIQEVITTEYPDQAWTINYYNRQFMMEDIKKSFQSKINKEEGFDLLLYIETKFMRDNPTEAKEAVGRQNISLNLTQLDDCYTMKQLQKLSDISCAKNPNDKTQILFQRAYQPLLILGATKDVFPVERKIKQSENQKYDLMLEFQCPDKWLVRASKVKLDSDLESYRETDVNPNEQCQINVNNDTFKAEVGNKQKSWMSNDKFTRFNFTLFSMFVSGSFLAGFSVKTFYLAVAYGASGSVRTAFIFGTWKGFIYEITDPMAIIKVFEACYMYRFEQDLYNEEECYRIIQEIIRSPDLLKALTGSSLRGQLDPMLDKFSEEDKKKYRHLERLEARGKFDVSSLKENIVKNYKD